jgi:hypothetical protein
MEPHSEGVMSLAERLRVLLVCAALEMGVLGGVPMRPDEIQDLMRQMNQPKWAHVLPAEDEDGGDSPTERDPDGP